VLHGVKGMVPHPIHKFSSYHLHISRGLWYPDDTLRLISIEEKLKESLELEATLGTL